MSKINSYLKSIYNFSGFVAAFFLILVAVFILTGIASRIFGFYIRGLAEYSGYCMAASSFFALAYTFIDGGHGSEPAHADYENWVPKLLMGGKLLIHDVFENPEDGGRPPFEIFQRALASQSFDEIDIVGSLRILKRVGPDT